MSCCNVQWSYVRCPSELPQTTNANVGAGAVAEVEDAQPRRRKASNGQLAVFIKLLLTAGIGPGAIPIQPFSGLDVFHEDADGGIENGGDLIRLAAFLSMLADKIVLFGIALVAAAFDDVPCHQHPVRCGGGDIGVFAKIKILILRFIPLSRGVHELSQAF